LGERVGGTFTIGLGQSDNSRVVDQIAAMEPDYVFFGGYALDAGPLLRQLREAGVAAPFMSGEASKHPEFGRLAGDAAEGALVLCACADPTRIEPAAAFVEGMREAYGPDSPGTFAVEAYDVTTLVVEALSTYEGAPADTRSLRAHVVAHFADTQGYEGLAKTYAWDEAGNLEARAEAVWVYEWDSAEGAFVAQGPASDFLD
ncbi:MAG TPA: ABC transporter substrate-binding protein, partial [Actinomycetota bacterium]|nr:ABC transporter substrate-binding protein [Actinomycetota bacterium]